MLVFVSICKVFRLFSLQYEKAKEDHKIYVMRLFICLKIAKFWKKRNQRFAPSFEKVLENKIRWTFSSF